MSEEYLWDRSGKADEDVARMEELLGGFRQKSVAKPALNRRAVPIRRVVLPLAVAAGIAWTAFLMLPRAVTSWQIDGASERSPLRAGDVVQTDSHSARTLESSTFGRVEVEPRSTVRVGKSRLELRSGVIHALIWAPPGEFIVDTPSAKAVDLGCRYTLQVQPDGSGKIRVETGWVAFEKRGIESFIPAGAACATYPAKGPGIPYFEDAPPPLIAALDHYETGSAEVERVIRLARKRDALSLWHLMRRTKGEQQSKVFDAFAKSVPHLEPSLRQAILRGDDQAFDQAWNALELGDAGFWRKWTQRL